MYQQSRFEAQCWFFTSLIIAIIGTVCVLGTIPLLFLLKDASMVDISEKLTVAIANIVIGAIQHLIITQTRSANKRADRYASMLNHEANELHANDILQVIVSSLPEGKERDKLLIQIITDVLTHNPYDSFSSTAFSGHSLSKDQQKHFK
jgi:hypothetical protein